MGSKVDRSALKDGGECIVRDVNEGFVEWNFIIVIATPHLSTRPANVKGERKAMAECCPSCRMRYGGQEDELC